MYCHTGQRGWKKNALKRGSLCRGTVRHHDFGYLSVSLTVFTSSVFFSFLLESGIVQRSIRSNTTTGCFSLFQCYLKREAVIGEAVNMLHLNVQKNFSQKRETTDEFLCRFGSVAENLRGHRQDLKDCSWWEKTRHDPDTGGSVLNKLRCMIFLLLVLLWSLLWWSRLKSNHHEPKNRLNCHFRIAAHPERARLNSIQVFTKRRKRRGKENFLWSSLWIQ